MKQLISISLLLTILLGCTKPYTPRETISISIENYTQEGTSIRAIEVLNDSTLLYAGSIGDIATVTKSGKTNIITCIEKDSLIPHFRSLSITKNGIFALSVGNPAHLYKITDTATTLVYSEEHDNVFYDSMHFFDDKNGIAMGDPIEDCVSVILTENGGKSWKKISCSALPKIDNGEAAFAASNTNLAIVDQKAWMVTGGNRARVFLSEDMGKNWRVYDTPIIQGKNTTGIYTVAFYDELNGIIAGGDYTDKYGLYANKAITSDGGISWHAVGTGQPPHYVSCIQYIPNTEGKEVMAVSTNGIFYSKNAGKDFTKIADDGFYSLRFVDRNTAWLSGNEQVALMHINK